MFLCILLSLFAGKVEAANTYDWVGGNFANHTAWTTPGNWKVSGITQSTKYPGSSATTDIVRIGVTTYATNHPALTFTGTLTIASIEFGDNDSGSGSTDMTLTINTGAILNVTGTVIQDHDGQNNDNINTTITGLGTLSCNIFTVGDATTPSSAGNANHTFTTSVTSTIANLTVSGASGVLNLNSEGLTHNLTKKDIYNPIFNLSSGILTVADIATKDNNATTGNSCTFNMDIGPNANTLILTGATMFASTNAATTVIDFVGAGTLTQSNVTYSSNSAQTVYTTSNAAANGINTTPSMYPNLTFSGTGAKTVGTSATAGTLSVGGDWTTSGGTVALNTFNQAVTVSGDWINTASVTQGTATIGITSDVNNNSGGTITESSGTVSITGNLNNTGGIFKGSTTTGITNVTGALANSGTVTVNNEAMTFTGAASNTGSYLPGTGTGTSLFSNGLTNSGTFTGGGGTVTVTAGTGTLTNNNPGIVNGGAGTITIGTLTNNTGGNVNGNATAGTIKVNLATGNAGTITVNKGTMTFTGLVTNSGTYDATTGSGTSAFNGGLTNSNAVKAGAGTITITNFINNSSGGFTGSSTAATTSISGTLTNDGTITVNNENITIAGAAGSTGSCTAGTGTGAVTFGNSYINTGTFNASAIFNAAGPQTITDNSTSSGTIFTNVQFQGSGIKTLAGSKGFAVSSSGTLTMAGTTTLATTGLLTLNSDGTGSAIVAIVPAACTITGNVNVQRFIKGGANKRGYRLGTSSVFNGTPTAGVNVFELSYLANTLLVSGPGYAANGFNVATTENPSIYLFREDVAPPPSSTTVFTTGYNWKGVAKINNSPSYIIGTQAKATTANVNDATTTIPVGNGFLLFDRGNNSSTTGKTAPPFSNPEDLIVTEVGQLNIGNISATPWYTGTPGLTFTSTSTGPTLLVKGFALMGNPYAAPINWEKYNNNTNFPGAFSGTMLTLTIWEYNPTTKNFDTYIASNSALTGERATTAAHYTGQGTNYIASGMGFFVEATGAGQTLNFTENAKVTTNGSSTYLNVLMGKPVETAVQPTPYFRLKLITDSVNNDDIVIGFDSKASNKYVLNEDAKDLGGNGAPESLSSFSSDSIALAINNLPLPGKQPQVIRLLTDAVASGSYNLAVPELGNMPQLYTAWLKDAFTADSVQLKLNTSYPFTIDKSNAATFGSNRFTVVIRQDSAFAYKLLDFTATKTDHQSEVQLVWKTVNEENYTRFTIERSADNGKTFNVVGGMLGTGAGNYSLVDKNPGNGRNLYRLKQEDINDSITYSKVIDVRSGNIFSKLHIFPNPATHTINLAIAQGGYYGGSYSIKFMNSAGRIVKEVQSSQPEWQGNISYLMPGTYLVRVINTRTQNLVGENKFVKL